jgi:hypothetical protein
MDSHRPMHPRFRGQSSAAHVWPPISDSGDSAATGRQPNPRDRLSRTTFSETTRANESAGPHSVRLRQPSVSLNLVPHQLNELRTDHIH